MLNELIREIGLFALGWYGGRLGKKCGRRLDGLSLEASTQCRRHVIGGCIYGVHLPNAAWPWTLGAAGPVGPARRLKVSRQH
jgi:hypothetical protein